MGSSAFEILIAPVVGATLVGLLGGATILGMIHALNALIEHGRPMRPVRRTDHDRMEKSVDLPRFKTVAAAPGFMLTLHRGRSGR